MLSLGTGVRVDYRLLDSSPPAEISLAKLLADLQAIGITFTTKLEQNASRLEKMASEARQKAGSKVMTSKSGDMPKQP